VKISGDLCAEVEEGEGVSDREEGRFSYQRREKRKGKERSMTGGRR